MPFDTTRALLRQLPHAPAAVYHGPVPLSDSSASGYADIRDVLRFAPEHRFKGLNAAMIVDRILARSAEYLERQRKKGIKADREAVLRAAELGRQQG